MRLVKYFLGLIFVCLIGFFSVGLVKPTIHYENNITINKPVHISWNLFTNDSLMDSWADGFKRMETIKGKPTIPGSEFKITIEQDNKRFIIYKTIRKCKKNESLTLDITNDILLNQAEYIFTTTSPYTTQITSKNTVRGNSIWWRSLFFFSRNYFKKADEQNLTNLKKLIENQP